MNKLDNLSDNYIAVGSSAMGAAVSAGIMRGRSYGGVSFLKKKTILDMSNIVSCEERFCIIRFAKLLIINIYMSCHVTADRDLIINICLSDVTSCIDNFSDHKCIIASNFNCNLNVDNVFSKLFNYYICLHNLIRCDVALGGSVNYPFHNETRDCYSTIDDMLSSDVNSLIDVNVIDSGANLSDHLVLQLICTNNPNV